MSLILGADDSAVLEDGRQDLATTSEGEPRAPASPSIQAPFLLSADREAIHGGIWFNSLSPTIRHDLLCRAVVRRYADGELIHGRHAEPSTLDVVVQGAMRISPPTTCDTGPALAYLPRGSWFVDAGTPGSQRRIHFTYASGRTKVVSVEGESLHLLLLRHEELRDAVSALRQGLAFKLFDTLHDLATLPLTARIANCLLGLCVEYGSMEPHGAVRIGIALKQGMLARMVGASRQRLNLELKRLERQGVLRVGAQILVMDRKALAALGSPHHT